LSLLLFLFIVGSSAGDEYGAQLDEYMKSRAEEARRESLKAYKDNPEDVAEQFNQLVSDSLIGANSTRRDLRGVGGGCRATNPIDRCWRCDNDWAKNRKKLADCVRGFGHDTTGGKNGRYYLVTDPSDNDMANPKPGTLRHAVIQKEPLWIIFAHSMIIRLNQELIFTSHKTIDGRGVQVHIANGAGLTIQFVTNVIIHNIWIHNIAPAGGGMIRDSIDHIGLRTMSDGDAISIYGSSRVWIDHVSLSKAYDGLIDAIQGSTAITISNCKFNHHNDVMLLGAHDDNPGDAIMQVTVAFNRFGIGCIQRMPRVRWGFVHVVNNDYQHWELYAIGGSAHPTIISQGNRYRASDYRYTKEVRNPNYSLSPLPPKSHRKTQNLQVTKRDYAPKSEWSKWKWRSEGDFFMNGAFFTQSGSPFSVGTKPLTKRNVIKYKPGTYVGRLTRNAGAMKCRKGSYC
ncbi:hypothetical protein M569_01123, partial [Genlisea aurea]